MVLRFAMVLLAAMLPIPGVAAQAPPTFRTDALGDPLPQGAIARLGTMRFKHVPALDPTVDAVGFSPDGKKILSWVNGHGSVRVWDAATGKELPGPWDTANQRFSAVVFSPDSAILATAGISLNQPGKKTPASKTGAEIMLWNISSAKLLKTLNGLPQMRQLAFADGGKTLLVAGDGAIRWLDVDTGKELRIWKPFGDEQEPAENGGKKTKTFFNCAISPDAKSIAVQLAYRFYMGGPQPAAKQPGGQQMVDQVAIGFDLATEKMRWRSKTTGFDRQVRFAFSADAKRVAIAMSAATVELRDAFNGKLVGFAPLEGKSVPNEFFGGVALNSSGSTVAIAGKDSQVTLWSPEDAVPMRRLRARIAQYWGNSTQCLAFSPDDKQLLVGADADLQVYDVATLKEVVAWEGHRGWVDAVAFSADGKRLVTGSAEINFHPQEVATWDVSNWRLQQVASVRNSPWPNFGIPSPDYSVFVGKTGDDRFSLFDNATGKLLSKLSVPKNQPANGRGFFSPGNKFFVLAGKDEKGKDIERLYAVPSGKLLCELPSMAMVQVMESVRPVAFSLDNRLVALFSRDNGRIHIIETATGKVCHRLGAEIDLPANNGPGGAGLANLAFSHDSKLLASWNTLDNIIRVWDVATGRQHLQVPNAQPGPAIPGRPGDGGRVHFAWSPDSRMLAVGGTKIRLWEMATLKVRRELEGHADGVRALAFSPDGRVLASASKDTTVLIWDAASANDSMVAANVLTRETAEACWQLLAGADAAKAFAAICDLAASPQDAVALISQRVKPTAVIDPKIVEKLIGQLDDDQYKVRQRANSELLKIGEQIVPPVNKVLAGTPTLETRLRLQDLRDKMTGLGQQGERLQWMRAVETLERIGTTEARQVLQSLAGGAPGALLTVQAQAALERLK